MDSERLRDIRGKNAGVAQNIRRPDDQCPSVGSFAEPAAKSATGRFSPHGIQKPEVFPGPGVPTASGQKTTLSQCGIGPSQRAMPLRWNSPSRLIARVRIAERVAIIVGVRGERVGVLLSEVDLPRFGVLDPRIISSLARVKPPITSIIRNFLELAQYVRATPPGVLR